MCVCVCACLFVAGVCVCVLVCCVWLACVVLCVLCTCRACAVFVFVPVTLAAASRDYNSSNGAPPLEMRNAVAAAIVVATAETMAVCMQWVE